VVNEVDLRRQNNYLTFIKIKNYDVKR
jgi:hypothetical protein